MTASDRTARFYGMLGFARKAGKTVIGTELICRAMPKRGENRIRLVIISDKASDATRKKLAVKSEFYGIKFLVLDIGTEELGRIVGRSFATATVAVSEEMFACEILKLFTH